MPIALHIVGFVVFLVFLNPILSSGKIADGIQCSECHTMHASQDGKMMGEGAAREGLLLLSCIGCHTGDNPDSSGRSAPFVNSTISPEYRLTGTENNADTLAGGTFYWSYKDSSDENKGHNVNPNQPPSSTNPPGGDPTVLQLTCAGATGCHGNLSEANQYTAMYKSHHADDSTIDGLSVGTSYRFLSGVEGLEHSHWELPILPSPGLSSTKHNQYKGSTTWNNTDTDTITSVCVRCHENFHGSGGEPDGSSPWLRHPTDISLPTSGEFASYTTYNPIAPVASVITTTVVSDISTSTDNRIITCISCHCLLFFA